MKNNFLLIIVILLISLSLVIIKAKSSFKEKPIVQNQTIIPTGTPSLICDNADEIQEFEKPIPIAWTATLDSCLGLCWGATFTRLDEEKKYPRFVGWALDNGKAIKDKFLVEGLKLKISGNWISIGPGYASIENKKCMPIVDIENIEILN